MAVEPSVVRPATPGGPSLERFQKSYEKRRPYRDAIQYPPLTPGVADSIDVHCHAHEGQQDALALAQHASRCGMGGLLYKTLPARKAPTETVAGVYEGLQRWAEQEDVAPIQMWAGFTTDRWNGGPTRAAVEPQLQAGVRAIWMPTASHANSVHLTGGRKRWWDPDAGPDEMGDPMPLDEAIRRTGMYVLKDGKLDPEVAEIVRLCKEHDAALFFGHLTPPEQDALAEEIDRQGFQKAVVDHPFSLYVDMSIERMVQFARIGIFMNFTYDELSPLMGVDPNAMYQAIRAVGTDRCTLSSDAGEPLFPNSVEAMRLIIAYMRAFGLTAAEIEQVTVTNPRYLVGAN
jgi:hypothetical protein